jgi:hypothetical protein
MSAVLALLRNGYGLLLQSKLLAALTVLGLLALGLPWALWGTELGWARDHPFLLVGAASVYWLVVGVFVRAGLIGSFLRLVGGGPVTLRGFVADGGRYFTRLLGLTLLVYGLIALVGGVAAAALFSPILDDLGWLVLVGGISVFVFIPATELAPIVLIRGERRLLQSVGEGYRLAGRYGVEFLVLALLFWGVPYLVTVVLPQAASVEAMSWSRSFVDLLVDVVFKAVGLPTLILFVCARLEPAPPTAAVRGTRTRRIALAAVVVGVALVAGLYLALPAAFRLAGAMPQALETPGVRIGPALLDKTLVVEDQSVGDVSSIVAGELDPRPGLEIGVAGSKGALFLDEGFRRQTSVQFTRRAVNVQFIDLENDGSAEFMSRGSWACDPALFDHQGNTIWTYGGESGVDDMASGDLNGDGALEFAVGFNGDGGVHLLDQQGKTIWRQPDGNVWHVEVLDIDADGKPEIVHTNAGGQIKVRDRVGEVVRQSASRAYVSHFSLVRWPGRDDRQYLLAPQDGTIAVRDVDGRAIAELDAPLANRLEDVRGTHAKLRSDAPGHFVALVTFGRWRRAVLYLYDSAGTLVYQEVLPEAAEAIAALPSSDGQSEDLFVGGAGKVWRYRFGG